MSESSFNIESATNGLVLALFLVSALFLGVMLYYILQDIDARRSAPNEDATTAEVAVPPGSRPASAVLPQRGSVPDSRVGLVGSVDLLRS